MKKRFALILGLAAPAFVVLLWTHQTVIGQNGVLQAGSQADVTNGCPNNRIVDRNSRETG